jgi:hypothetical protein
MTLINNKVLFFNLFLLVLWYTNTVQAFSTTRTIGVGSSDTVRPRTFPSPRSVVAAAAAAASSSSDSSSASAAATEEEDTATVVLTKLQSKCAFLTQAAETKAEDSDAVVQALLDLEQLSRQAAKLTKDNDNPYAKEMLHNLHGSWRLIFTTGTVNTQKRLGKINYFPLKAIQSFNTATMTIANGIYIGDFCVLKFQGDFTFDGRKRKLEFDFDQVSLFQIFDIALQKGEAASLGAKSGLGSDSNVANAAKNKRAFFNWISADENIATARGGGGGLALWKRVVTVEEEDV